MRERAAAALLLVLAPYEARAQTPATVAGLAPAESAGRGARVPFFTLEAEDGVSTGTREGPSRTFGTLAAEASGRQAVRLVDGQTLDFVLPAPADAITLRYALPDSADGQGLDGSLELVVDGTVIATLALTSRYSWYYGAYPFTNRPADGKAHHFFDHARARLPRTLPAGTRITLRRGAAEAGGWTLIDLADFECVPPPALPPAQALSVRAFGADPSGERSALAAFRRAIAAGRRRGLPVWIPPGRYRIDGHLDVDRVTLAGAGHWHSVLFGSGIGIFGRRSRHVQLRGFALIGEVAERVDAAQLQGIGGAMSRSTIEDLWIQHTKVGLWMTGPMDRLAVRRVRVYDQAADGLNFHRGVTRSMVEDSFFRGLGDDGLAMWSQGQANAGNRFRRNTVIAPTLANGIALYGGRDLRVEDNVVADTLTQGGGLHVGARFDATPFAGEIAFRGNMAFRTGSWDPNWNTGIGAFWIYALDHPILGARITLADTLVVDGAYAPVRRFGKRIDGLTITGLTVREP